MEINQRAFVDTILTSDFSFEFIDRPVGPQPLPEWVIDAKIDWMEQFGNPPKVRIRVSEKIRDWGDVKWKADGKGLYYREHPDGRREQHYHNGPVGIRKFRRWKTFETGEIHTYPPKGEIGQWSKEEMKYVFPLGAWVDVDLRGTTKQDGYGGREFVIEMEDGPLILHGPWHISAKEGYPSFTAYGFGEPRSAWSLKRGGKWWSDTGCFGYEVREDVLTAIVSRFEAHVELARVTANEGHYKGQTWLEWVHPEYGMPKSVKQNLDRLEFAAKREKERAK